MAAASYCTRVMQVCGIQLPISKWIWASLQSVYGVGPVVAARILVSLDIRFNKRTSDLSEEEQYGIRRLVEWQLQLGDVLKRDVNMNISKLKRLGCYKGLRHRRGLPVRGQRTRTNAHTRKYARAA
ncbi:MAG: 30S ribosomal protein S13 [Candidatus Hodgkinia cicadicola]